MAAYNKKNQRAKKPNNRVEEPLGVYTTRADDIHQSYIARSIELLGLSKSTASSIQSNLDFVTIIRNGIPKNALDTLLGYTGISTLEIADIVHTSDRTLRRYTEEQKLNPDQTERLIQLAYLYSRGEEVFDSLANFKEWMGSDVMALGHKKPKEFLDTSLGINYLLEELGRIEHGIFA